MTTPHKASQTEFKEKTVRRWEGEDKRKNEIRSKYRIFLAYEAKSHKSFECRLEM